MYPTMFKIPYLPDWLADIKSYGVMMMIAFLSGIWLACRRAYKTQANPDIVLNAGFLALIFGVIGARAMFVIHYWSSNFANQPNPIWAVFDIRAGGLEFYGGPLLVVPVLMIYMQYFAKASARWYLDITMPSLAWGLAITRVGCFLNGCCWGAICVNPQDPAHEQAAVPWAVRFPYGSPAMVQQYGFGELTLPKELIRPATEETAGVARSWEQAPVPREYIEALADKTASKLLADREAALEELSKAQRTGADPSTIASLQAKAKAVGEAIAKYDQRGFLVAGEKQCRIYDLTPRQLVGLADHYRSKPVHPAQLYETIGGFIICWVLSRLYYYRTRHGIVAAWFLILYGIMRFMLELIREDNPLDVSGLTISQSIAVITFMIGWIWLFVVYKMMPVASPLAIPYVPPEDEEAPPAKGKKK